MDEAFANRLRPPARAESVSEKPSGGRFSALSQRQPDGYGAHSKVERASGINSNLFLLPNINLVRSAESAFFYRLAG